MMLAALAIASCGPSAPAGWAANGQTRWRAERIDPDKVAYVELLGPTLWKPPTTKNAEFGDPQKITDKAEIRAWVMAFRHSMRREDLKEQVEEVANFPDQVNFFSATGPIEGFSVHPDDLPQYHGSEITDLVKKYRQR